MRTWTITPAQFVAGDVHPPGTQQYRKTQVVKQVLTGYYDDPKAAWDDLDESSPFDGDEVITEKLEVLGPDGTWQKVDDATLP